MAQDGGPERTAPPTGGSGIGFRRLSSSLGSGGPKTKSLSDPGYTPPKQESLADRALEDPGYNEIARELTLEGALEALRQTYVLVDPFGYTIHLLGVAESYLIPIIELLFFIGIRGEIHSGKSRITRALGYISSRSKLVSSTTAPVIARVGETHDCLLIDRVDRRLNDPASGEHFAQLLDASNERGLQYSVMEKVDGKWQKQDHSVFGMRIVNYVDLVGKRCESTKSRIVETRVEAQRKGEVRRSARRYWQKLAPVKLWLEREVERARRRFRTLEDVEVIYGSKEFVEFSDWIDTTDADDRVGEFAELMWVLAEIMGWEELKPEIRNWVQATPASKTKKEVEAELVTEAAEVIRSALVERVVPSLRSALPPTESFEQSIMRTGPPEYLAPEAGWVVRIPREELFQSIVGARERAGKGALRRELFAAAIAALGIHEGGEDRMGHGSKTRAVIIRATNLSAIGLKIVNGRHSVSVFGEGGAGGEDPPPHVENSPPHPTSPDALPGGRGGGDAGQMPTGFPTPQESGVGRVGVEGLSMSRIRHNSPPSPPSPPRVRKPKPAPNPPLTAPGAPLAPASRKERQWALDAIRPIVEAAPAGSAFGLPDLRLPFPNEAIRIALDSLVGIGYLARDRVGVHVRTDKDPGGPTVAGGEEPTTPKPDDEGDGMTDPRPLPSHSANAEGT